MVAATLSGITRPEGSEAQHLRHGPQVDVESQVGRGLPPESFLIAVDPLLKGIREKIGGDTGLLHDLGKVLCLYGEPQWSVVGDTFPVGCAYSDKIVFPEKFAANPDSQVPEYQTRLGVYSEGCGLSKVDLSWGTMNICIW